MEKKSAWLAAKDEICRYMEFEVFVRIQNRLAELQIEEQQKLLALAELQKAFVSANSDFERDYVKESVGKIREMAKESRREIRELKQQLTSYMAIEKANELYALLKQAEQSAQSN